MTISWWGDTSFFINGTGGKLLINPPKKDTGLSLPSKKADLILFSQEPGPEKDWKKVRAKDAMVVTMPGEYDVAGYFVLGLGPNGGTQPTIFLIQNEQKTLCHITSYPEKLLSNEVLEHIGNVDVLFVPVGEKGDGDAPFTAAKAVRIANQIGPSVVIPMHYAVKGIKEKLEKADAFLKEFGASGTKAEDKLTIAKNRSFSEEETEVALLNPRTT